MISTKNSIKHSKKFINSELEQLSKSYDVQASLEILKEHNTEPEYFKLLYVFFNRLSIKIIEDNKEFLIDDIKTYKTIINNNIISVVEKSVNDILKIKKLDNILSLFESLKKTNKLINDKLNKQKEDLDIKFDSLIESNANPNIKKFTINKKNELEINQLNEKIKNLDIKMVDIQKNDINSKIRFDTKLENIKKSFTEFNDNYQIIKEEKDKVYKSFELRIGELEEQKNTKNHNKQITKINEKINIEINKINDKLNEIDNNIQIIKSEILNNKKEQQKNMIEINQKITQLIEDNKSKEKEINEFNLKLSNNLNEIKNLKNDLTEYKKIIDNINKKNVIDRVSIDENIDVKIHTIFKFKYEEYINQMINYKFNQYMNPGNYYPISQVVH